MGRGAAAHAGQVVGHHQAHRPAPAETDLEQPQRIAKGVHLRLCVTGIDHHTEQPCRQPRPALAGAAQCLPMRVAGCAFKRRVQHLRNRRLLLQPQCQTARRLVVGAVAQTHCGQCAQHRLGIVARDPQAQAHVGQFELHVQVGVARNHAAHQHIPASAREFGQGMGGNIHAQAAVTRQIKRRKSQPCAPGVVQRRGHATRPAHANLLAQVRKLHRQRPWSLQPHQACCRCDARSQIRRIERVIRHRGDAKTRQLSVGHVFAGAVGVVWNQHLVARLQQRQPDDGNGCQAAGHQQALCTALQRAKALFKNERGRRAVQPIGVGALVLPLARAHGSNVRKDDC